MGIKTNFAPAIVSSVFVVPFGTIQMEIAQKSVIGDDDVNVNIGVMMPWADSMNHTPLMLFEK